jgi:hypothetical protein
MIRLAASPVAENRPSRRPRGWLPLAAWTAVAGMMAGCACYHFGTDTLYPPDIHTVYVPMFESDSFRRALGEKLTEAVCKEIEKRTPFKVVGTPNADSVLTGTIKTDTKHSIVREPNNEGRVVEMGLVVKVSWADRHGIVVRGPVDVPVPPELVNLTQTNSLIPEYGQSTESSLQQTMQRLAQQIVDMMETPW